MEKYFKVRSESTGDIVEWLKEETWSGAKSRIESATEEQIEAVAEYIGEAFDDSEDEFVSETTLNDFVWFDCDHIFFPKEENSEEEDE